MSLVSDNFLELGVVSTVFTCARARPFSFSYPVPKCIHSNRINFQFARENFHRFCRLRKILFSYYRHFHTFLRLFFVGEFWQCSRVAENAMENKFPRDLGWWQERKIKSFLSRAGPDDSRKRERGLAKCLKLQNSEFFFAPFGLKARIYWGKCCCTALFAAISYDNSSWNIFFCLARIYDPL